MVEFGGTTPAPAEPALVVVPTYNERPNLEALVHGIRAHGCAVLVVDDSSPDGTGELADRLAADDPAVQVLHRPGKLGLGSAHIAGLTWGAERGHDLLLTMDADGSHKPEHLPALISAARTRRAMVIGSRYVSGGAIIGWPRQRMLLSHGANVYCRTLLGVSVHDCTSGYRCYPREVVGRMRLPSVVSDGYAFLIETLHRCVRLGIPVAEVPIHFEDRVAGRSKVSAVEIGKALALVPRLRWAALRAGRPVPAGEAGADELQLSGTPLRRQAQREPAEVPAPARRP
jgi:dolichol-phosphate mannosyltransferase